MAIIGYDDIAFAAAAAVPLSSIRQPRAELGRRAAELLLAEIEAADGDEPHQHEQVRFVPELVVRRSTAALPPGVRPSSRPPATDPWKLHNGDSLVPSSTRPVEISTMVEFAS